MFIIGLIVTQLFAMGITFLIVREVLLEVQLAALIVPVLVVPALGIPFALTIKHLKETRDKHDYEEKRLKDIVFSSGDWIWEVDKQGRYTYVLGDTKNVLGYENEEFIGKSAFDFMLEKDREKVAENFKEIVENKRPIKNLSNWNQTKTGEIICMLTNGIPLLDKNGELLGYRGVDRNITEFKKMTHKLKKSEKRFREFAEMLPEMVCETDTKGIITFANHWSFDKFEYTQDEIVGKFNVLDLVIPEDRKRLLKNFSLKMKGEDFQETEYTAITSTGKTFPVLIYSNVIHEDGKPAGVRGVMIDISNLKHTEEQLKQLNEEITVQNEEIRQNNEELRTHLDAISAINEQLKEKDELLQQEIKKTEHILEFTPSAIFTVDRDQKIVKWNKQAEAITGYSKAEAIGKHCSFFALAPCTERCGLYLESVPKPVICVKCEIRTKSGEIRYMEKNVDYLKDAEGNIIGGIESFLDVTERLVFEENLKKAKEEAEQAAIAKSQFLSTMSHEIRTPMNAVIGMTHLLIQENPKDDQLQHLKTLKFSAENLLILINDILDYNKIESGKISFEEADFNMNDLLEGLIQSLSFKAEEGNNKLILNKEKDLPVMFVGDSVRLNQVLTNLVGNATKFTSNGNIAVNVKKANETEKHIDLLFEVVDTGIGIPEEKQKLIFERFQQASQDTTRKYGGTGLGLAITKLLLELQGSEINLKSKEGEGSNFYFTLRFKKSTKAIESKALDKAEFDPEQLKGTKLLLVEDNAINVFVAKKFLGKWNVEIDEAENGLIALEKVQQNQYDIILMDLQMPEMNGYEATKEIRGNNNLKDVPIIALTASVMEEEHKKAFSVGMNDFVTKPFNPTELYKKIIKNIST
jgi:PAS domain S-box-containing protein